jgi:methylmalonyl-CoA epimerase
VFRTGDRVESDVNESLDLKVDHLSIAVPRIDGAMEFFQRHFPFEMGWKRTLGYSGDFTWCDFYIGCFKLELIEPAGEGGFLRTFLDKRGPGLHHWSMETLQLDPLLERMQADGIRIVDRFATSHGDRTAFVSPRSAFGILIQFWQVPALARNERPEVAAYRLQSGDSVRMRVDHVSIAVRDIDAALDFFRRYLPFRLRRPSHPGWDGTFLVASFYLGGYKVELIQNAPGRDGFVKRFIERRGEGFHHVSVDVERLDPYVDQLEAVGVRVVDRQDVGKGYKTAFISPRSAHGVLIQLWELPEFRERSGG